MLAGIGGAVEAVSSLALKIGEIHDPGKGPNPSPPATDWPACSSQQWFEPEL